jgi:hypothetical protein
MKTRIAVLAGFVAMAAIDSSFAAPVTYSFSTGLNAFGGSLLLDPSKLNGGASGSFTYDSSALKAPVTNADGSFTYFGAAPFMGTPTATSNLVGNVGGYSFSDPYGLIGVGNDTFASGGQNFDIFQLFFEVAASSPLPHNLSGFTLDGFQLANVRMFWIEGQAVPETIGDFLTNQNLPAVLPSFHGRIAFDFVPVSDPLGARTFVFFDGLSVHPVAAIPEPETYTMLLAGLGLFGFMARRRRLKGTLAA